MMKILLRYRPVADGKRQLPTSAWCTVSMVIIKLTMYFSTRGGVLR